MNEQAFSSRFNIYHDSLSIFASENRLHLSIVLTFLLLLLYSHHYWYIKIPLSIIAIYGLIFPRAGVSRLLWTFVVLIVFLGSYKNWYIIDNHKYLLGYWCFALLCCFYTNKPEESIATTSRILIGLVFIVAVIQKTISPNYLDSTFMYYELLMDERFRVLTQYIGGLPDFMNEFNSSARKALVNFDSTLTTVKLQASNNVERLAIFITWWNYLIQIIIGLAFLLPKSTWLYQTRDIWLCIFLFTTYLFAPVIGFGWVLAIIVISQTENNKTKTRVCYVIAFLFLQAYRLPWYKLTSLSI